MDFRALLTPREMEVTECIADGCSNLEIAERLEMSRWTAKTHLTNIFDKVGCSTRLELASIYAHHRTAK